jgi:hypothetical protein
MEIASRSTISHRRSPPTPKPNQYRLPTKSLSLPPLARVHPEGEIATVRIALSSSNWLSSLYRVNVNIGVVSPFVLLGVYLNSQLLYSLFLCRIILAHPSQGHTKVDIYPSTRCKSSSLAYRPLPARIPLSKAFDVSYRLPFITWPSLWDGLRYRIVHAYLKTTCPDCFFLRLSVTFGKLHPGHWPIV